MGGRSRDEAWEVRMRVRSIEGNIVDQLVMMSKKMDVMVGVDGLSCRHRAV